MGIDFYVKKEIGFELSRDQNQFSRTPRRNAALGIACGHFCMTGTGRIQLRMALRSASYHLCLLLRAYISHHQTSEQGGRWSRWSYSRRSYGDHVTWSEGWTGSAAGDWSYNWASQVVSHRDECSEDDDRSSSASWYFGVYLLLSIHSYSLGSVYFFQSIQVSK